MKTRYDQEADALYITIQDGQVHRTLEVDRNILIDIDLHGQVLGIEILFVKERNLDILDSFREQDAVA